MSETKVSFFLNNKKVHANENESIWQVSKRLGEEIPQNTS